MCKHVITKFEDCSDEYLYGMLPDEEVSNNYDWYGLYKGPNIIDIKDLEEDTSITEEIKNCIMTHIPTINLLAGIILEENNEGFVTPNYYETEVDLMKAWKTLEREGE